MQPLKKNEEIFSVDSTSDLPIWIQLRNRIIYLIRSGHYKPGEQLPSIRSLSTSARINYNTVTKAYRDLEQSNLIVSIRGRGMYVQKNVSFDSEAGESAIDLMAEDCIRQYRSTGMAFDEVSTRLKDILARLEKETQQTIEEKMEYFDV